MTALMFDTRRDNLRKIVLEKFEGNRAAFSRAAGVNQNQINLLLTDNVEHRRNLGEALARRMEAALHLESGWFDLARVSGDTPPTVAHHMVISGDIAGVFRNSPTACSVSLCPSLVAGLQGRITGPENLVICGVSTRDMEPVILMEDTILVDAGVKAITVSGVYVLVRGQDTFLRRVTRQITGGWLIENPSRPSESVVVETLKGIKTVARVVMVWRTTVL